MNAMTRWWKDAVRIDGRSLLIFLLVVAIAAAFTALASVASAGGTLVIDRLLIAGLRDPVDSSLPMGPRWFHSLMLSMTAWGNVASLTVLTAIAAGYLLVTRKTATAAFLVGAVVGGALLSSLLKATFNRARPDVVVHLVEVHTTSFPSGHATNSAIVFLTLGALLSRVHTQQRVRIYILSVAILLTLTIGFSRVYLGVHWPSDVVAGWMVGSVWATLCWMLARRLQRQRTLEQSSAAN